MRSIVRLGAVLAGVFSAHTVVNVRLMRRPSVAAVPCGERVSVCIPARDEEANIERCVRAVLASDDLASFEILVFDDGSADDTAAIVSRVFADAAAQCRLIDGGSEQLPSGWLGKPWACERLQQAATGDVLVFLDADVVIEPRGIAAAIELLRRHDLALVSPYPRQIAVSGPERLVQPLLQWLWLTFLPLRLAERTTPNSMAAANGQFLVVDAAAVKSIGGFNAVRCEVLDDVALVRAMKRAGSRGTVVDGTDLATCRMYTDWTSLRDGYAKNLWAASGSVPGAIGLGALLALAYIVPPLGLLHARSRRIGFVGYLLGVGGRMMTARATGGRVGDSVAHPVSIAVLLHLLRGSWSAKRRGALSWKGRRVG